MGVRAVAGAGVFGAAATVSLWTATAGSRLPPSWFSHGGAAPVVIGPTPRGLVDTAPETCASCHAEIAAEWRGSQHARAFTDPVFQAAYALEPLVFCRNCHAPENSGRDPTGAAAALGVACAACHVRNGTVLTGATPRPDSPHAVAPGGLESARFCAACHQFNFVSPDRHGRFTETAEVQQDTFGEWARSSAAEDGVTCQHCHMPWVTSPNGRRHRSHAFPGGWDADFVRSAVFAHVTATREGEDVVVVATIEPRAIGHAFPTGDLFRRAELRVAAGGQSSVLRLDRQFEDHRVLRPGVGVVIERRQVRDTRVAPPSGEPAIARTLRLTAVAAAITDVHWALDYHIMPTPMTAASQHDEAPVRTHALQSGVVPIATPAVPASPTPRSFE